MRHATPLAAALALALATPGTLRAMPNYPSSIPNGSVYSCATCHLSAAGGGTRNSFGNAFAGSSWGAIDGIDCDLDGQTNGQELGDPCGVWQVGQTPGRVTDISQPGDATSTSATPDLPACTGTDAGAVSDASAAVDSSVGVDRAPATDTVVTGDGASGSPDATTGADVPSCTPVCLDRARLFACSSSGQHVEQPCPTGTECHDGVCQASSTPASDDDDDAAPDAGCGCQGAASQVGTGWWLLALALALHRRRAWAHRR